MVCNACGVLLSDTSKFCNNCGAPVGSSEPKDETELDTDPTEEKTQAKLSREEAEKLIQKLAEAGVTIEVKYAAQPDDPSAPAALQTNYTVFLHAVGHNRTEVLQDRS